VSSLREQAENILRSWFGGPPLPRIFICDLSSPCTGTRWLTRFDKEVELGVRLAYHALTTGRGRCSSQPIPFAIIEPEYFSDPNVRRGVYECLGTPQVGTGTTHPGSARPPSHHPVLPPGASWTVSIPALPTLKRCRDCSGECDRARKRDQRCTLLHHWGVLSPRAETFGRTTCARTFCRVFWMALIL
jgi:hypothetical protein